MKKIDVPFRLRYYQLLLRLLPAPFRRAAEREMIDVFEHAHAAACERGRMALIAFWLLQLLDLFTTAFVVRFRTRSAGLPPSPRNQWRLDGWRADFRYAFRSLSRSPAFVSSAVVTLGLGIGVTTVVFSLFNTLFLRPLPHVVEPGELVRLSRTYQGQGGGAFSYPDYADVRDTSRTLTGLMAYDPSGLAMTVDNGVDRIEASAWFISDNYFDVLGTTPALGRWFNRDETRVDRAESVVIISESFWDRGLARDADVVGSLLRLNGHPFRVVGIAPAGFVGSSPVEQPPEMWVPIAVKPLLAPQDGEWALKRVPNNSWFWLSAIGRTAPDAGIEAVRDDIEGIALSLEEQYGEWNDAVGFRVDENHRFSPQRGIDLASTLTLFLGAVTLLLLVACANVAVLLLARGSERWDVTRVRIALGADRLRIIREWFAESALLASMGAVVGIVVAWVGSRFAVTLLPVTTFAPSGIDPRVLAFVVVVSIAVSMTIGVLPAFYASRITDFRLSTRGAGRRSSRIRDVLVTAQVALSVVLLAGAFLFGRSVNAAAAVDVGFETEDRLVMTINLRNHGYDETRVQSYVSETLRVLQSLPGVRSASTSAMLPFNGAWIGGVASDPTATKPLYAGYNTIGPAYFETMGIDLVGGREFSSQDSAAAEPVVVVNEHLARTLWGGENPLGRQLRFETGTARVIGVARNANYYELAEEPEDQLYLPVLQYVLSRVRFIVHTDVEASAMTGPVRDTLLRQDSGLAIAGTTTLEQVIEAERRTLTSITSLVGIFAAMALLLAVVGIYGSLAYLVRVRRSEIGIRFALGATRGRVGRLVVSRAIGIASAGVLLGVPAALVLSRFAGGFVFGVAPRDPISIAGASLLLVVTSAFAGWFPARRAARIDPVEVLKEE